MEKKPFKILNNIKIQNSNVQNTNRCHPEPKVKGLIVMRFFPFVSLFLRI